MKAQHVIWPLLAVMLLAACNRTAVEDDEEPPVNVVRPEKIVTETGNVAVPLTNLPAATNGR